MRGVSGAIGRRHMPATPAEQPGATHSSHAENGEGGLTVPHIEDG